MECVCRATVCIQTHKIRKDGKVSRRELPRLPAGICFVDGLNRNGEVVWNWWVREDGVSVRFHSAAIWRGSGRSKREEGGSWALCLYLFWTLLWVMHTAALCQSESLALGWGYLLKSLNSAIPNLFGRSIFKGKNQANFSSCHSRIQHPKLDLMDRNVTEHPAQKRESSEQGGRKDGTPSIGDSCAGVWAVTERNPPKSLPFFCKNRSKFPRTTLEGNVKWKKTRWVAKKATLGTTNTPKTWSLFKMSLKKSCELKAKANRRPTRGCLRCLKPQAHPAPLTHFTCSSLPSLGFLHLH